MEKLEKQKKKEDTHFGNGRERKSEAYSLILKEGGFSEYTNSHSTLFTF